MKEIFVCGVDEVGRGALAGPMMAGAALFRYDGSQDVTSIENSPIPGLADSKSFSTVAKREKVWKSLLTSPHLVDFGLGEVSVEEINRKGIDWANQAAFQRAIANLNQCPHYLIVDGTSPVQGWPQATQTVTPKADASYWPVSAASIIAKVIRDRLMIELHQEFPLYGWDSNMGYGSSIHQKGVRMHGATPHHRTQFIRKLLRG